MAQSAVTVRIDSEMKSQFDELCEQFGMSANTAFNIFVKAVIRSRSIPFAIRGARLAQPSALDLFMQQRRAAEASQEPEMTLWSKTSCGSRRSKLWPYKQKPSFYEGNEKR